MSEIPIFDINDPNLIAKLTDAITDDNGNMLRSRPYDGQPHTCTGKRGSFEIRGITFRDLRDAYIRAIALSCGHKFPHLYAEAEKGEHANLSAEDVYQMWDHVDPIAVVQNLGCEVERLMGIFPNIERRK